MAHGPVAASDTRKQKVSGMTPEKFIEAIKARLVDAEGVDGALTVSDSGSGAGGASFMFESDDAQYRMSIHAAWGDDERGWASGSILEKDGAEIGYLPYCDMTDKAAAGDLVEAIERHEARFAQQREFRAGWDSAETAQEARINAALDQAKVI